MQRKLAIFQPDIAVTLGTYRHLLTQWQVPYQIYPLYNSSDQAVGKDYQYSQVQLPEIDLNNYALIILGGRMNAYSQDTHAWLTPLENLLKTAVSLQVPVLGICLGHQILANCLGGKVTLQANPGEEEGPVQINLTEAGKQDPLFREITHLPTLTTFSSHHDLVSQLPQSATLLATSNTCHVQAFRLGSAIGVQFHPEADSHILAQWETINGTNQPAYDKMIKICQPYNKQAISLGKQLLHNFITTL